MSFVRIRVAGILIKNDRILLVRHEKGGKSYHLLPGGGVEFGETIEQALIREFKEETGIDITVGKLVLVHDSLPKDLHRQVLNLYFVVTAGKLAIKVTPDGILKDADFYLLDDFSKMTIKPDVKNEILLGHSTHWGGNGCYLGNRWQD